MKRNFLLLTHASRGVFTFLIAFGLFFSVSNLSAQVGSVATYVNDATNLR